MRGEVTVSIVSHGQISLVNTLLKDLADFKTISKIIVTHNIPSAPALLGKGSHASLIEINNRFPAGFSANHNRAFEFCETDFFAVINPDLRLGHEPFFDLLEVAQQREFGVLAPLVKNGAGELEDSARYFPTIPRLVAKVFCLSTGRQPHSHTDPTPVDWVAGMFMLFKSETFAGVSGFDERYFLYYEDADICTRLWQRGLPVIIVPTAEVIHNAQRQSHRSLRYLKWHLGSMARYLLRYVGRLPRR